MQRRTGWWIVGVAALVVAVEVALQLAAQGTGLAGVRGGLRATARSSLVLFSMTFVASSLVALRPAPWSKWLLRHRRHLGLSFALSHGVHLALIIVFAIGWPAIFGARGLAGEIVPVTAYLLLLAMVITSTDGARARLGGARWRALHRTGMYLAWGIFTVVYVGRTTRDLSYAPALILLIGGLGLRIAARLTRRGHARQLGR